MPQAIGARRIASVEPCEIEGKPCTVWDLSAGGLYVVIEPPPDVGTRVHIAFSLPNEQKPVRAEARIAWRNPRSTKRGRGSAAFGLPPGCGLEFLVIDAVDLERIERHVRMTPVLRRLANWRRAPETVDG